MARKVSFKQTLDEATRAATLWETIPELTLGDVGLQNFVDSLNDTRSLLESYTRKKAEIERIKHNRDQKLRELSDLTSRFRRGIYGHFGKDSAEYAQAGGTPSSARKPRRRNKSSFTKRAGHG